MRNEILVVLVTILVVGGLGLGYLAGASGRQVTTAYTAIPLTQTITLYSSTFTSTSCTYTSMPAGLGCPNFWNQTFTILVNYTGAWVASYQGYLGSENASNLAVASSFYGHGMVTQSFTITGWTPSGGAVTGCAEAQKLDSSNSKLILSFPPIGNAKNETSSAFGTAKFCVTDEIV